MSIEKFRTIFGVEYYEISNDYIYELRLKNNRHPERVFSILPRFTINTNEGANNRLIDASYFLQFVGFDNNDKDKKHVFINVQAFDNNLKDEINNLGEDEFFKDIDFNKLLEKITPQTDDDMKTYQLPDTHFFIGEIEYDWSRDLESGSYELDDLRFKVIGYFDSKMNSIFFENL